MRILEDCFVANRRWAARELQEDPDFFKRLAAVHRPEMLWIGCSDARLPPNEIIGRRSGELFVHRNVANVVVHSDLNCLSVLQFAIEVLEVKHVIVCGHYGCGGIATALDRKPHGLIDNWLRHVRDVRMAHDDELQELATPDERVNKLAELNVKASVANVCHTTIVQDAWRRGQELAVHGWIYALSDGLLRDLGLCIERPEQIPPPYQID
ncbi:MAG: carbonate dehydratase [Deltaproteobacteria bacterium]|nr:carbonate dehydratase [Kofleriaceae bacterium]